MPFSTLIQFVLLYLFIGAIFFTVEAYPPIKKYIKKRRVIQSLRDNRELAALLALWCGVRKEKPEEIIAVSLSGVWCTDFEKIYVPQPPRATTQDKLNFAHEIGHYLTMTKPIVQRIVRCNYIPINPGRETRCCLFEELTACAEGISLLAYSNFINEQELDSYQKDILSLIAFSPCGRYPSAYQCPVDHKLQPMIKAFLEPV